MRFNLAARTVRGSWDEVYAAYGPPRSGKSNWLATVGLDAPGACLFTSTRADLAVHTAAVRARKGPVLFLNPGGDGGFPSTLCYSPLAGCRDPRMAMESAGALMHAAPKDSSGKDAWWDHQSKTFLQYLLHAAALDPQADIRTVRRWARFPDMVNLTEPAVILSQHGTPGWAGELMMMSERVVSDLAYGAGVCNGVLTALAWLDDPALAWLSCPGPGEEFDAVQFIRDQGTVYVIGADSPHNPQSPYFACFATYLWNTAKRMAADPAEEASSGLKLDPRLMMIIDEPAITCPVPLDRWATEAAGHGIVLVTGFQSDAQLPQRFGEHGGKTLETLITVKIVFGGDPAIAEKAAGWGGDLDTWHGSKDNLRKERAFLPERICNLPMGQAFVKHRSTRAFIAEVGRVEDHPLYERAEPGDFTAPARLPVPQLALEPSRRDPIVTPAPPRPAVTEPAPVPALTAEEASWPVPASR